MPKPNKDQLIRLRPRSDIALDRSGRPPARRDSGRVAL